MSIDKSSSERCPAGNPELVRVLPPKTCHYHLAHQASGQLCALCEAPIVPPDVQYTVEWKTQGKRLDCQFHLVCYHLWFDS